MISINSALGMTGRSMDAENRKREINEMIQKWDATGLLKNLKNPQSRRTVAQMLENQARQLIKESENSTGGGQTVKQREEWNGIALPLVRRVFDSFSAKEFLSVQPMHQPSGLVFYLDFKYGTGIGSNITGFGNDTTPAGNKNLNSVYGVTDIMNQDPQGGMYGAGRYSYTGKQHVTTPLNTGSISAGVVVASVSETDFNFDSRFSASFWKPAPTKILKVSVSSSKFTELDTNAIRSLMISSSGASVNRYFPEFTTWNPTSKVATFLVSASFAGALGSNTVSITYTKQPQTALTRGDFEARGTSLTANPEVDLQIPELDIEIQQETIVAKTKKLKAQWTYEFATDLQAYQALDAELELTTTMTTQITNEIDNELLDMLRGAARTTDYWSARVSNTWDGTRFVVDPGVQGQAYNQQTWFASLGTKFQKMANKIHQKTMRGQANFAIVSPDVATVLESIPGYVADTDGTQRQFGFGVQKVGAFSNRFTIYKNPYLYTNQILMGFRGSSYLETGAAYCPYVPLVSTPIVLDPKNFTPRKGVQTRYAKIVIRPEFYGIINVAGLESI